MIHILGDRNSVFNNFMSELRDIDIQTDPLRFRRNMERVGEVFAYEISKTLTYKQREVQTPLGISKIACSEDQLVIATILRAGLPLHQGFLNYFDRAENAFISAYRKYSKDGTFHVNFEYLSSPSVDDKIVILCDPMLATGQSMSLAYEALLDKGKPKHTHIVAAIASKEGVEFLRKRLSLTHITLWLGAVDDELTIQSYIVPGLGDAGDLAYGGKDANHKSPNK